MFTAFLTVTALLIFSILAFNRKVKWGITISWGFLLLVALLEDNFYIKGHEVSIILYSLWIIIAYIALIRINLFSRTVIKLVKKILPNIGETEKIALEAGSVWFDKDLFSGNPDWKKMFDFKSRKLTQEEQDFIDGPTEKLCKMLDDWEINRKRDLPEDVWKFIKDNKFFGMIIPKEYGGLGYSALTHSAVVTKLASRSVTAAVTVMVPNSLGPAELLLHYGTQEQKDKYLKNLAKGKEIPCFALTEPEAGSDATSIKSYGIICEGKFKNKKVIGIKLNFAKRYITLAPIATLIGLAFKLYDPDGLLGDQKDLGITCALLPRKIKGMQIGDRHDPMGIPFQNGPIFGKDVFIPLDYIIGGQNGIGKGWRMLTECLAAGRSISLPALSVGATQLATAATGAYATIREQFNLPLGKFEAIQEKLAHLASVNYMMNAARIVTCGALDDGAKPSVVSAIVKAYMTEFMRENVDIAMDILAGSAICKGPKNMIANGYTSIPIAITVEGANILTRSLIIFGQGAIRCHPYIEDEIQAIEENNVKKFDKAFFSHVGFFISNIVRAIIFSVTGGITLKTRNNRIIDKNLRILTRYSTAFALVSDFAMLTLGGSLKRREMLSGRFADIISFLYLSYSSLKFYSDENRHKEDALFIEFITNYNYGKIDAAFAGILDNLPNRISAKLLKLILFPLGNRIKPGCDKIKSKIADSIIGDSDYRKYLTKDIYIPEPNEEGLGKLEKLISLYSEADLIRKIIFSDKSLKGYRNDLLTASNKALAQNIISEEQQKIIKNYVDLRSQVISVDYFNQENYNKTATN